MSTNIIGQSVKRREDYRFLTGAGQYTDDVQFANQTYACFLRSPHAHARIKAHPQGQGAQGAGRGRDLHRRGHRQQQGGRAALRLAHHRRQRPADEGAAAPGARAGQGALRRRPRRGGHRRDLRAGEGRRGAGRGRLRGAARGRRRRRCAQDRARPRCTTSRRTTPATSGGSATRRRSTRRSPRPRTSPRSSSSTTGSSPTRSSRARRPRATARADDSYTLYVASQNPHVERLLMTAFVLGLPEHKVRVIAPDVGGGFGSKIYLYAEDVVVTWALEADQPADQVDRRALRVVPCRTRTAATTSPWRSSRSTRTASSSRCACTRPRTWAPICRRSPPAFRPSSTRRCSPASTRRR